MPKEVILAKFLSVVAARSAILQPVSTHCRKYYKQVRAFFKKHPYLDSHALIFAMIVSLAIINSFNGVDDGATQAKVEQVPVSQVKL